MDDYLTVDQLKETLQNISEEDLASLEWCAIVDSEDEELRSLHQPVWDRIFGDESIRISRLMEAIQYVRRLKAMNNLSVSEIRERLANTSEESKLRLIKGIEWFRRNYLYDDSWIAICNKNGYYEIIEVFGFDSVDISLVEQILREEALNEISRLGQEMESCFPETNLNNLVLPVNDIPKTNDEILHDLQQAVDSEKSTLSEQINRHIMRARREQDMKEKELEKDYKESSNDEEIEEITNEIQDLHILIDAKDDQIIILYKEIYTLKAKIKKLKRKLKNAKT